MQEDYARLMRHHRAAWRVERVGWCVIALLLAAALAGAFGNGALSQARIGVERGFTLEYDRLLRSSAPAMLRFHVQPALRRDGVVRLRIDRTLLDRMEIESIVPEPVRQVTGRGYTEFIVAAAPDGAPVSIDLRYRASTFGRFRGNVSVAGEHAVAVDQFVYP